MSLSTNLQLAREINLHVRNTLKYGSNNRASDKEDAIKFAEANKRIDLINHKLVEEEETFLLCRAYIKIPFKLYILTHRMTYATEHQAGNCVDHAAVGFLHLIASSTIRPLAMAQVKRGNVIPHTLIIIGDPQAEDAVVCDPYEDEAYPLAEFCHSKSYAAGDVLQIDISINQNNEFKFAVQPIPGPLQRLSLLAPPRVGAAIITPQEDNTSALRP
jgi:hypothetical protein